MNSETLHLLVDGTLIPLVAIVGWLLNRAIGGVDSKLVEIRTDLNTTSAKVIDHSERLAVIEYRLNIKEHRP